MADKAYRGRNFATVIYSEENEKLLRELKIPCFISPWHDKDINPNGEPKKPHKHVLINYEGVKSIEQVQRDISEFGGVGCEVVKSNRAYGRYLCHLDNPEKAQYNINDVTSVGGLDYIELINSTADEFATLEEICDYILDNNIVSFRDFLFFCRNQKRDWYLLIIRKQLYCVKEIIKSNYIELSRNM